MVNYCHLLMLRTVSGELVLRNPTRWIKSYESKNWHPPIHKHKATRKSIRFSDTAIYLQLKLLFSFSVHINLSNCLCALLSSKRNHAFPSPQPRVWGQKARASEVTKLMLKGELNDFLKTMDVNEIRWVHSSEHFHHLHKITGLREAQIALQIHFD